MTWLNNHIQAHVTTCVFDSWYMTMRIWDVSSQNWRNVCGPPPNGSRPWRARWRRRRKEPCRIGTATSRKSSALKMWWGLAILSVDPTLHRSVRLFQKNRGLCVTRVHVSFIFYKQVTNSGPEETDRITRPEHTVKSWIWHQLVRKQNIIVSVLMSNKA